MVSSICRAYLFFAHFPGASKLEPTPAAAIALKLAASPDVESFLCQSFPSSSQPLQSESPISSVGPLAKKPVCMFIFYDSFIPFYFALFLSLN